MSPDGNVALDWDPSCVATCVDHLMTHGSRAKGKTCRAVTSSLKVHPKDRKDHRVLVVCLTGSIFESSVKHNAEKIPTMKSKESSFTTKQRYNL